MLRKLFLVAMTGLLLAGLPRGLAAQTKGRVLVVLSGATELSLRDGKRYQTGFFLNEVVTPVRALIQAGYEPVFASPYGGSANWDPHSAVPAFFGGSQEKLDEAKRFVLGLEGVKRPRSFAAIRAEGVESYVAVLVPGGHAAMQDLPALTDLGVVLTAFHTAGKPTGLICHGPLALLSALPDPVAFLAAMEKGDSAAAQKLAAGWPYAGYQMTVFSTSEERFVEPRLLGGEVLYFPAEALAQAGGRVVSGPDRRSATVRDRELITGQQPASHQEFTEVFLSALEGGKATALRQ